MSELTKAERETIIEHSGEWVINHIDALESDLAAAQDREKRLDAALAEALGRIMELDSALVKERLAYEKCHDTVDELQKLDLDMEAEHKRLKHRIVELETSIKRGLANDCIDCRADERKKTAQDIINLLEAFKPVSAPHEQPILDQIVDVLSANIRLNNP